MDQSHYLIREYPLQQGALEIAYIEEFFSEFPRRKTAAAILRRLEGRPSQILMAESSLPDDPTTVVPVSYKVSHELREDENGSGARGSRRAARRRRRVRAAARSSTTGSARRGSTGAVKATSAR